MAVMLFNPRRGAEVTHQGVTRFEVRVPHKADNTIDKQKIALRYEVTTWDSDGNAVGRTSRTVPVSDWPKVVKQEMQQIYFRIQNDAIANNLIGDGVQEEI